MINKVTITGADDSILPDDLIMLTEEFPFVEWGILMSQKRFGTPRYPSLGWLQRLRDTHRETAGAFELSCHLCGQFVRDFVQGDSKGIPPMVWEIFNRVQLNFHNIPHQHARSLADKIKQIPSIEFIFQYDGVNDHIVKFAHEEGCKVSALFDKSGGAGVLPKDGWPAPFKRVPYQKSELKCGYAGGLSPENLKEQWNLIEKVTGTTKVWIDVETHVRSNMDHQFDCGRVREFLRIAEHMIA